MVPLVLLFALGVALTAYESSARVRVDDYVRALRGAHEAHRAADAHLINADRALGVAAQHGHPVVTSQAVQVPASMPEQASMPTVPLMPPPAPMPIPASVPVMPVPAPAPMPAPPVQAGPPAVVEALKRAAQVAVDAGMDHLVAATVANQQAAQDTAAAAKHAKTQAERQAAADSSVKVLDREKRIAAALSNLGVGQCGVRSYSNVTPQVKDAILAALHADGMTVTGDNPWDVDTQQADVKLRAVWDPDTQVLRLIVTASAIYAPCAVIWERIEPKLRGLIGS